PDDTSNALVGPVRQVDTAPTHAAGKDHSPHAIAETLTGGLWPAERSTAMPCPFCTTSTVIASGTTSSRIADHVNCGAVNTGAAKTALSVPDGENRPDSATAPTPASRAPRIGGIHLPRTATELSRRKTITIGAAIATSDPSAATRSMPNFRNTPATIAMTMGMGSASITRRTRDRKSTRLNSSHVKTSYAVC